MQDNPYSRKEQLSAQMGDSPIMSGHMIGGSNNDCRLLRRGGQDVSRPDGLPGGQYPPQKKEQG